MAAFGLLVPKLVAIVYPLHAIVEIHGVQKEVVFVRSASKVVSSYTLNTLLFRLSLYTLFRNPALIGCEIE